MTSPVAGWYPDPSGRPGERWWNGVSWSDSTRAAPVAPPTMTKEPEPSAPHGWDGFGNPAQAPGPPPPSYGTYPPAGQNTGGGPTYPGGQSYPGGGSYPGGQGPAGGFGVGSARPTDPRSWLARNGYSFATLGVTVGYLLILFFAHFAILGLLPAVLAYSAVKRREQLAWPAVVVAVLVFVYGVYQFSR